jgi:alpha-glucosidase
MTTPGAPMLFMGDELGLEGRWGEDARRPIPWDAQWDATLLDAYRRLISLRRSSDALSRGGIRYVHASDEAVVYLRETRRERLLCLAARADHAPIRVPFTSLETLYGDEAADGVLPSHGPSFHIWRVS